MDRKKVLLVALVLTAAAAAILWRSMGDAPEPEPVVSADEQTIDAWEDDDPFGLDDGPGPPGAHTTPPRDPPMAGRRSPGPGGAMRFEGAVGVVGDGARRRRRGGPRFAGWRERRRQRMLRRLDVAPLGPSEANPTTESVADMMRDLRQGVRQCMIDGDIPRETWREARGVGREMHFTVTADGRIDTESFTIDPPLPEALHGCFVQAVPTVQSDSRGEGAEVTFEMPARRRGGDMGVR